MDSSSRDYCTRLNLSFDLSGIELDTSLLTFNGEFYRPQKYGVSMLRDPNIKVTTNVTYQLKEEDKKKIISQLPPSLIQLETPTDIGIMEIITLEGTDDVYLPPHVDKVRLTAINFYLETNADVTTYYNYNQGKTIPIFDFVANKHEAWLLDVDKPHSVKLKSPVKRKILTISFKNLSYKEVLSHVNAR
jgi:hypothetical protein